MRAGKLYHRITIQAPTYTRGADGSNTITYTGTTTIWANVKEVGGNKVITAEKDTAVYDLDILVRYNVITETINEKYQIIYNGQTYEVTNAATDETSTSRTIKAVKIK